MLSETAKSRGVVGSRRGGASAPHELVRDGTFELAAWSGLLSRAARQTHAGAEAISPFGFELGGDRSFLRRDLSRFYVLLRLDPGVAARQRELAVDFLRALRRDLKRNSPEFARSVGVWRANRANIELVAGCAEAPLRMVNVLSRVTDDSALGDYADYLVCCARGILDGRLGEAAAFETSTRARRRLFQLVEMIGEACELALGTAPVGRFPHHRLYADELAAFARGHENQPIVEVERELLRDWALPALARLAAAIETPESPSDTIVRLAVADLYSPARLTCTASRAGHRRLRRVVAATYRDFFAA